MSASRQQQLERPITITPEVRHLRPRIPVSQLRKVADNASKMLVNVRESMLAPHPRKNAPVFTTSQLATLCRVDRKKIIYSWDKSELGLPPGIVANRTREFTLAEARQWIAKLGPFGARPAGVKGKKIAVGNFKGGVSKTTTSMTLAQALSLYGRRVLVIDLDPQASLTALFGMLADSEVSEDQTVLPLIYGEQSDLNYAVQSSYWDGIDLIPASATLFSAEFYLPFKQSKNSSFRFWDVLNSGIAPLLDAYDVVIIDTPPALSYMTINAFMAADGLIVPTPPSALDYASSTQFWNLFADLTDSIKDAAPEVGEKEFDFIHVLLSKVDSNLASTHAVRDWINRTYESFVLPLEIPTTTVTAGTAAEFGTVYDISKYDGNARTYQRARDAYDHFAEVIDKELVALWNAEQESV